jgi:UDP-N-acetylmuramoyl-tripeptide--D-alanyl-D-alanine ligase
MRAGHRFCAIELGMNHKGEIAYLADIARPSVALVNNAQREHLEFMNSVEEVAEENAGIYAPLPRDGVAVVNADDAHAPLFRSRAGKHRVVDFGIESPATVSATYALKPLTSEVRLTTPQGESQATLAIPGLHNVRNAVAAAACAFSVDIDAQTIARGLSAFRPYAGRLQVKQAASGATVIDDTYNANPDSVRAAIDVLASCKPPTVLVLGDMGEVGAQGPEFHREVGAYARSSMVSNLFAIGDSTKYSVEAFGAAGYHAKSLEDLLRVVRESAKPKTTLLVKGSRFMKMERVVAALTGAAQGGH